jgi:peptide subunit release factor 1 (eRF1)
MFRTADVTALLAVDRADVLSAYLNVDPTHPDNQRTPPAWRIWLKNAMDELTAGDHASRVALQQLIERVNSQLADFRPSGKGLAVFAGDGLWQTMDLPVPVDHQLALGRPRVAPLLWLLDEYERYGVVQVNHREARLWLAYLGRSETVGGLAMFLDTSDWRRKDLMPSGGAGITQGSLRDAFEQRVNEHTRSFWREVVGQLETWVKEAGIERVVLGGDEESVAEFRTLLPQHLADQVVGTLSLPFHETDAQILERVLPLAESVERRAEADLVERVVTTAMKGGRAALGRADVLAALQQGRVQTVVTTFPVSGPIWECADCHHAITLNAGACPVCDGPLTQRWLEGLLPLLAHRTDATVEIVSGAAAQQLAGHEGMAAVLRY